ncbi:hypothetical protein B7P43_G12129 [Cryptotermes secundus]|uniref:Uncharacterized protein n=1 Tax=Cryptotermes secundus TaxID=105785 RepID=A0A2J7R2E4_9NEOP|nr:hypothetical protein B7P43_G12129 [Cryptotermes secundus]
MEVPGRELNASGSGEAPAVGSIKAGNLFKGCQLSLSQGFCSLERDLQNCSSSHHTQKTSLNVNVTRP